MTTLQAPPRQAGPPHPATISEVEAFVAALESAGCDSGPEAARVFACHAAIAQALDADTSRHCTPGLLSLEPDQIADRVRLAAADAVAARDEMASRVGGIFLDRLAADAVDAIRDASTGFIAATLRPQFDTALAVVQKAADCGITSTTDPAFIVEQGNPKMLAGFRALPDAVATLDTIGRLRDQLTDLCGVGDHRYPIAAYLATATSVLDLEGAAGLDDKTEMRDELAWHGPIRVARTVPRCGGKWLALITSGYTLRLNNGDEADAVVAAAEAADAEEPTP